MSTSCRDKDKFSRNRRKAGSKQLRSLFLIVVEGETEKAYFDQFKGKNIRLDVFTAKGPDPDSLIVAAESKLEKMKREGELKAKRDQAWIVFDRDNSTTEQIESVFTWASSRADRGIGFSSPQFEYWLLLHCEEGTGVATQHELLQRLQKYRPNYAKGDPRQVSFTRDDMKNAVERATRRVPHVPATLKELEDRCGAATTLTTVHGLVKELLENTR